ncbi:MAG: FMN-binding negative transcriptional regulator [Nocardioidaceae bacterium]
MHPYPKYPAPSDAAVVDLVRSHPFALVVTGPAGRAPVATHIPVILPPSAGDASLEGVTMLGHMGRANPHWELFSDNPETLAVFSSSHGYVSPSVYEFTPAAPTLDYATVHLTGEVRIIDDRDGALDVVEQTVAALEGMRPTQWDPTDSKELFERIIGMVVAFTFTVTGQQSMFKLSQDKAADVRGRVRDDLAHGPHRHPDVVALMDTMEEQS